MNAQEVEIESGECDQRMNPTLLKRPVPVFHQSLHVSRSVNGLHGRESNSLPPVRVFLYDVAVALLILPCVTNARPAKAMQLAYQLLGEAQLRAPLVDKFQRVAVAAHLFLVPVARVRFPEDDRPDPRPVYLDALDPVRGDRALDDRVLAQNL